MSRRTASRSGAPRLSIVLVVGFLSLSSARGWAQPEEPAEPVGVIPTASFFTRYELRENYAGLGKTGRFAESDGTAYRARFGLRTAPIEIGPGKQVVLLFEPQASGFWADATPGLEDAAVGVHQATLHLDGASYSVDVGRFEMAYGDHLVIGNVGWHETGRSFDGLKLRTNIGGKGAWIDVFATQIAEGRPVAVNPPGAGDAFFSGAYAGFGPLVGEGDLDAYLLSIFWPKNADDPDPKMAEEFTVGGRLKRPLGGMADLRAEAGVQLGKRPGDVTVFAFQGEGEVGFEVSEGMRLAAGGFFASGDDPDSETDEGWNQLFPTAHKFLGFADVMGGRSNAMGGMVRYKNTRSKQFVGALDAHLFLRPQTPTGVDAYTGFEVDVWGLYKIGKGLGLKGGYALFVPNENGPYGIDTLAHFFELQLKYDLK